ncbi:unnamed protein product [Camellia sinensis]
MRESLKLKERVLLVELRREREREMKLLGWWLMLVGSLRMASVWFGFFDIWALRLAVFSNTTMTEIHGRTFGVWTLLTCTLCFLCAFNLDNKPLYLATFLSFIYALGHFLTEYLIYETMAIANLTTVSIFAGTSIIWMLLQWNAHQQINMKRS